MDQIAKIKESICQLLQSHDVNLYDLTWTHEGKHKILQVAIEKTDGTVDIDLCADMAELISAKLDEMDMIESEYMLEVCSPGAERKLRNEEEVKNAVGKYIYAKFKKPVSKLNEVKGTLISFEEGECCVEYMDKTFKRLAKFELENCSLIRLAVKI